MSERFLVELSDSDLSLQLSDASTLSSDSDHSDHGYGNSDDDAENLSTSVASAKSKVEQKTTKATKKTTATKARQNNTKTSTRKKSSKTRRRSIANDAEDDAMVYCLCRKGYDGKEFMIACDKCQEWFHGKCVGINPKTVVEHYFCDACSKSKTSLTDAPVVQEKQKTPVKKSRSKNAGSSNSKKQTQSRKKSSKLPESHVSPATPKAPAAPKALEIEEDLDDICPVCDSECTCGTSTVNVEPQVKPSTEVFTSRSEADVWEVHDITPPIVEPIDPKVVERFGPNADDNEHAPVTPKAKRKPKKTKNHNRSGPRSRKDSERRRSIGHTVGVKGTIKLAKGFEGVSLSDTDEDVVVDVDDMDDLVNDLSPLSDHSSDDLDHDMYPNELHVSAQSPFATSSSYSSSIHIDSGDDEDIEKEEERAIIEEMMDNSDFDEDYPDSDDVAMRDSDEGYQYDEKNHEPDEYYIRNTHRWFSSEEEDEEYDYEEMQFYSDVEDAEESPGVNEEFVHDQLLPILDENVNLFDDIAAAFLHVLAPLADVANMEGDSTSIPNPGADLLHSNISLLSFDLANALISVDPSLQVQEGSDDGVSESADEMIRRPSLPSSAVSVSDSHAHDELTSETLSALSVLASEASLSLPLPTKESDTPDADPDLSGLEEVNPSSLMNASSYPAFPSMPNANGSLDTSSGDLSSVLSPAGNLPLPLTLDLKLQQQLLESLRISSGIHTDKIPASATAVASSSSSTLSSSPTSKKYNASHLSNSRQILPKPMTNTAGSSLPPSSSTHSSSSSSSSNSSSSGTTSHSGDNLAPAGLNMMSSESQEHDSTVTHKKRAHTETSVKGKKRRISNVKANTLPRHSTSDFSPCVEAATPSPSVSEKEPTPVSMDDLVDTSQLDTRSSSRSPSPEPDDVDARFSRDLSRWQRIPIGAFRLLRAKNRLWLER
ncbi:hypothetical protein EC973_003726 [Apophysomyces ossiformis]|uniref:PHD-type domain-containing protein n=1 Tax=Apophysomyces ossiformis TaxID=679940 RepID=A0A8H7BFE9_9FUNG|nr:hypothetical protein EC973_003726 [Apophysomyces ossiformis]